MVFIFQIVNSSRILKHQKSVVDDKTNSISILKNKNNQLKNRLDEEDYFSLFGNQEALFALGQAGNDSIVFKIKDDVYEYNLYDTNPLIPFDDIDIRFLINKVKVLNHKWIIADFSDGNLWGELLIKYSIDSKGDINFQTIDQLIYPQDL